MELVASEWVKEKISRFHQVSFLEVEEAFFNHEGKYIVDDREENKTNPPTVWFVSETFEGRLLKVVLIPYVDKGVAILRTSYEPNKLEIDIYEKKQNR